MWSKLQSCTNKIGCDWLRHNEELYRVTIHLHWAHACEASAELSHNSVQWTGLGLTVLVQYGQMVKSVSGIVDGPALAAEKASMSAT